MTPEEITAADALEYFVMMAEEADKHAVNDAQDIELEIDRVIAEQDQHIKQHFGEVKITTSAEWRKRHL